MFRGLRLFEAENPAASTPRVSAEPATGSSGAASGAPGTTVTTAKKEELSVGDEFAVDYGAPLEGAASSAP